MSVQHPSLTDHPTPQHDRVNWFASAFGLWGGPFAWAVQLCAGLALNSYPCFWNERRYQVPMMGLGGAEIASVVVTLGAIVIALAAFGVAIRTYKLTREEVPGSRRRLLESGTGRTRFLALWGMCMSAGFALATAFNGISFILLPRCVG